MKKIILDKIQQFNLNLLLNNSYYPIKTFMNETEYNLSLKNNEIPIVLQIDEPTYLDIKNEKFIYLCDIFSSRLAKLHIENIYKPNIAKEYKLYKKKFIPYFNYFGGNYYHISGKLEKYNKDLELDNKYSKYYKTLSEKSKYEYGIFIGNKKSRDNFCKKINKNTIIFSVIGPHYTDKMIYQQHKNHADIIKKYDNIDLCFINLPYQRSDINNINSYYNQILKNYGVKLLDLDTQELENFDKKKGLSLWFYGLSGSGKTTLEKKVKKQLFELYPNKKILHIDGDKGINTIYRQYKEKYSNTIITFTKQGRTIADNVSAYRTIEFLKDTDDIVILTKTSPYLNARLYNKYLIEQYADYIEILVDTSLKICQQRDSKGLYNLVQQGKIKNFIGIDQKFEKNNNSDIIIRTTDLEENCNKIIDYLKTKIL